MTMVDEPRSTGFSLRRWSQRKLAATRGETDLQRSDRTVAAETVKTSDVSDACSTAPASAQGEASAAAARSSSSATTATATDATGSIPLPPLESLTIDSDFSPFMQAGVDENVKRNALRKLLRDPRFNVMDGLDVYIDDYSKPSPLEPELVRTLVQARYIFDPPKTRVTADGLVEDVPDEDAGGAEPAPDVAASAETPTAVVASAEPSIAPDVSRVDTILPAAPSVPDAEPSPAMPISGNNESHRE